MLKGFNMLEKVPFGSKSKCNSNYSLLQVLELLIMFPCFMIRNPNNYCRSSLSINSEIDRQHGHTILTRLTLIFFC